MTTTTRALFGRRSGPQGLCGHSLKQLVAWGEHLKVDPAKIDEHKAKHQVMLDELQILRERLASTSPGSPPTWPGLACKPDAAPPNPGQTRAMWESRPPVIGSAPDLVESDKGVAV